MSTGFVGRQRELAELNGLLDLVRNGGRTGRPGRAVLIRGRRRVGKSRLVEEFAQRAALSHVFFTATGASREEELASFAAEVSASDLPEAARFAEFATPQTWDAALTLLAGILPMDQPSMLVFDGMPYLAREEPGFEGTLQKFFDRTLSRLPVLLVLIGSDLAMMEALNTYGRPFYQRGTEMVAPFDGRDLARLIIHRSQLPGADNRTALLAVSRTGAATGDITALSPEDLLAAWDAPERS